MSMTTILTMLEMHYWHFQALLKIKHGMSTTDRSTVVCMGN